MGPLMLDVQGTSLSPEDIEILQHPLVGGLILFTRNFESPEQVSALCQHIKQVKKQNILLAVDHEGGRVQRFRTGFSEIPAMGSIYSQMNNNMKAAAEVAQQCGILMALEVQAVGIDISFAPVLDINDISEVIGDRAFDKNPEVVSQLASAFISGMNIAGMLATGKHFPGHGSVKADSHFSLPIDNRCKEDILAIDFPPFKHLIEQKKLAALMPAHIIFPAFDNLSVGFSPFWLQEILRKQLKFDGVIFSDDLSMEGAVSAGNYVERSEAAQSAGCDMLLLCNNRNAVIDVLDNANLKINPASSERLQKMLSTSSTSFAKLAQSRLWQTAKNSVNQFSALNH